MIATHKQMTGRTRITTTIQLIIVVFLLGSIALGWHKLKQPNTLPITTVKIDGKFQHINRQLLEKTLMPYVTHGFFNVDVGKIKTKLLQLPWVGKVDVSRIWPNTVVVHVEEKKVFARWGSNSLVTENGTVFTPKKIANLPTDLPWLGGPSGQQEKVLRKFKQLDKIFATRGLQLTQLTLSERQSWKARLGNGIELLIGQQDIDERVQRFVSVYQKVFGSRGNRVEYVDLRYPNGLAVRWK